MDTYTVVAFYKFIKITNIEYFRREIYQVLKEQGIFGTIIIANEGINGTVAGMQKNIKALVDFLTMHPGLDDLTFKYSSCDFIPFKKQRVVIKPEIVTLKAGEIFPPDRTGTYVNAQEWNDLINQPDVLVIDTRNDFEVAMGTFKNAVDPHTTKFSEFPEYVANNLAQNPNRKIAMFCTGGIRCEKASAYLLAQGFAEVYQLHGGILQYLQDMDAKDSLWQGECFIFDERIWIDKQSIKTGAMQAANGKQTLLANEI